MDLSILSQNKISMMTLDEKYMPAAIVLPFEGHSRQAKLMHAQVNLDDELSQKLWFQIIRQKIRNQYKLLSITGTSGREKLECFINNLAINNLDTYESLAAKAYFSIYHEGVKRREEDPINSCLNYGYAVVRSFIARSLIAAGFHPTFGIHHNNQLNAFNLADDLIEPYRPFVDLVTFERKATNIYLSREERREIAHVLHNACIIDGVKVNLMAAIDKTIESFKHIIMDKTDEHLLLPDIIPVESMEGITE